MATLVTPAIASMATSHAPVRDKAAPSLPGIARLASALFPAGARESSTGMGKTVLITSACPNEGVTTITRGLARCLADSGDARVLRVTLQELEQMGAGSVAEFNPALSLDHRSGVWGLTSQPAREVDGEGSQQPITKAQMLDRLKQKFDCIVIDAPAVQTSTAAVEASRLADGVLLVVAAGQSTRSQIRFAQQAIAAGGGTIEGFCLNRRTYPIPHFLYRWLGR